MPFGPTNLQGLNTFLALQSSLPPPNPAQQSSQAPMMPQAAQGQGIDIAAAFQTGEQAAGGATPHGGGGIMQSGPRGYADGGAVSLDDTDDESGLSSVSPLLMELARRQMADDGGIDTPLTGEDRGLALAQAGFAIAGGESPHALTNIGQGAGVGLNALQKLKQQRALQRMRESQAQQQVALRQAALQDAAAQKAAALKQAKVLSDAERDRKKEHDEEVGRHNLEVEDIKRGENDAKKTAAEAAATAATEKRDALAESRYQTQASARLKDYYTTGQWRSLGQADADHGIDGAPTEGTEYEGPLITSPKISLKQKQALELKKPDAEAAVNTIKQNLNLGIKNARELMTHPGLKGAVGFRAGQEYWPGSEAATFKENLDSLLSKQFAQAIQAMRDASKTGGAVGNVSDREGLQFRNMVATLSQSQDEATFKKNLQEIIDYGEQLESTYVTKYNETYGELKAPKANGAGVGTPAPREDPMGLRPR